MLGHRRSEPVEPILRSPIFQEDQIVGSAEVRLGSAAIGEDQPVAVCGRVEVLQRPVRPRLFVQDKLLEIA